jgi:hypothetical protein
MRNLLIVANNSRYGCCNNAGKARVDGHENYSSVSRNHADALSLSRSDTAISR